MNISNKFHLLKNKPMILPMGFVLASIVLAMIILNVNYVKAAQPHQIPTGKVPTVTGTPGGAFVTVRIDLDQSFVNLRAGPSSTYYDKVGVLLIGQKAPAKGRSPGGDWILVEYPGVPGGTAWVYKYLVNVSSGEIPIVEPPPTPTPLVTPTINQTFAAQFLITIAPSHMATFTAPPPLSIPTFPVNSASTATGGIPMGMVIIGLIAVGFLLGLISLIQTR